METPVYDGALLRAGNRFPGPALIEETTTTVVVPPRYDADASTRGPQLRADAGTRPPKTQRRELGGRVSLTGEAARH